MLLAALWLAVFKHVVTYWRPHVNDAGTGEGSTRRSRAQVDAFLGGMATASGETFDADETAATALQLLTAENALWPRR
jgi:hypothetical protein